MSQRDMVHFATIKDLFLVLRNEKVRPIGYMIPVQGDKVCVYAGEKWRVFEWLGSSPDIPYLVVG